MVPSTGVQDEHDATDHAPIVNPRFVAHVGQKLRLERPELRVVRLQMVLNRQHPSQRASFYRLGP